MGVEAVSLLRYETYRPIVSARDHATMDRLELAMLAQLPLVDQPLEHVFLPGLYVRRVLNPKGSLVTTKIHKTRHPFFVMKGVAEVGIPGQGTETIVAPYHGITEPGTRRVIYAHEDVVWITVHPNPDDETDLDKLEERFVERRELADGKTAHELFRECYQRQIKP